MSRHFWIGVLLFVCCLTMAMVCITAAIRMPEAVFFFGLFASFNGALAIFLAASLYALWREETGRG